MIPKLWENSEIQIICNCEIHDCWVKDCIKKKKKKSRLLHTDQPSPCLWMCVRQALVVRWKVRFTPLSQTWPGFLDSPPGVKQKIHLQRNSQKGVRLSTSCHWQKTQIINVDVGASDTTRGFSSLGNLDALKMLRVSACDSCVDINVCLSARTAARFGSVQNVSLRGSALKAASTMTKFTYHTSCNVAKSLRYRSKASKANRVWRVQKREKETIIPQP